MKNISDLTLKEMKKYLSKIGDKEGAREIKEIIKKDPDKSDLKVSETMGSQFNQVWKIKEHTYGFFDAENEKDVQ